MDNALALVINPHITKINCENFKHCMLDSKPVSTPMLWITLSLNGYLVRL